LTREDHFQHYVVSMNLVDLVGSSTCVGEEEGAVHRPICCRGYYCWVAVVAVGGRRFDLGLGHGVVVWMDTGVEDSTILHHIHLVNSSR